MALIDWTSDLSVNIAEIDNQHKKLIEMINELHSAMRQGKGSTKLEQLVKNLFDYAKEHFATEEKYFYQFSYPETAQHLKEHQAFVLKINEFKTDFANGQFGLSIEIMNFLSNWLQNHIKKTDKKFGPFFNEKGLK